MKRIIIGTLAFLAMSSVAFAQSTVTGTLSSGASGTTTGTSTVTGTVGSGNSLTGTVVSTTTTSTGGGGGGGGGSASGSNGPPAGGGGGGGGSNIIDICANLSGTQSALPAGYVLVNGNCVLAGTTGSSPGAVLGASTGIPNLPNTGKGGETTGNELVLALSALIAGGSSLYLFRRAKV